MPIDVELDNFTISIYNSSLLVMSSIIDISYPVTVYNTCMMVMTSIEDIPINPPVNVRNRYFRSFINF